MSYASNGHNYASRDNVLLPYLCYLLKTTEHLGQQISTAHLPRLYQNRLPLKIEMVGSNKCCYKIIFRHISGFE